MRPGCIHVLPREGVDARRRGRQVSKERARRKKSGEIRELRRGLRPTRRRSRRDSSRRYHRPATSKIETFVAIVRTPPSGPPSTSRLTLDPWTCSFSEKRKNLRKRDQSAGNRSEVLPDKAREIVRSRVTYRIHSREYIMVRMKKDECNLRLSCPVILTRLPTFVRYFIS